MPGAVCRDDAPIVNPGPSIADQNRPSMMANIADDNINSAIHCRQKDGYVTDPEIEGDEASGEGSGSRP